MTTEFVSIKDTPTGIEDLIIASQHLLTATEQQFESIRKEKWFNRVFDIVTFSQKKNIRLSEQIQTLSQAQNILLKMLVLMAQKHTEIASYISDERERIEALSQNDISLLRLYKNLQNRLEGERLGIKKTDDVAELSDVDKLALSDSLQNLSQCFEKPSELQQRYFVEIHNYIGCESEGDIDWENFCKRPEKARKEILQCCLEYMFLYNNSFELPENLHNFIDNFDLGSKTIKEKIDFVTEMFHARGAIGIIEKYSTNAPIEDIPDTFSIELEEDVEPDLTVVPEQNDNEQYPPVDSPEHNFEYYYQLAENGDIDAQFNLGACYHTGNGVEKNMYKAFEWYQTAAEQGHTDAQNRLGVRYERGEGVEENLEMAVKWYRKAAEQGHAKAQCNLGLAYWYGRGVSEDDSVAYQWFTRSANQGYVVAQYHLGLCFEHGTAVKKDTEQAIFWYERATKQGDADAEFSLARLLLNRDSNKAFKIMQKQANQNYSTAQYFLGLCYEKGIGIDRNPVEAVYWYKKAAEQEHPNALLELGKCYMYGTKDLMVKNTGVIKNLQTAREYLSKALEASEVYDFLDEKDYPRAHLFLAEAIYAQNVKDHLSVNSMDLVNCVPFVNFVSLPLTGLSAIAERQKLRDFLTTEEGRLMMYHCEIAAKTGYKYAIDMLRKLKKAL